MFRGNRRWNFWRKMFNPKRLCFLSFIKRLSFFLSCFLFSFFSFFLSFFVFLILLFFLFSLFPSFFLSFFLSFFFSLFLYFSLSLFLSSFFLSFHNEKKFYWIETRFDRNVGPFNIFSRKFNSTQIRVASRQCNHWQQNYQIHCWDV